MRKSPSPPTEAQLASSRKPSARPISIRVAAYSFTLEPIAQALLEAHERGIDVRAVMDKSNATARYTAATFLANQAVPVPEKNPTLQNVLVLHDPAVAQRYGRKGAAAERVGGAGGSPPRPQACGWPRRSATKCCSRLSEAHGVARDGIRPHFPPGCSRRAGGECP